MTTLTPAQIDRLQLIEKLRERKTDETMLTHQIRCYAEYVRTHDNHGSNRQQVAEILSAHAPYIGAFLEYEDRPSDQKGTT